MMERLSAVRRAIDYYRHGVAWTARRDYLRFGQEQVNPEEVVTTPLQVETERPTGLVKVISWNIQRGYQEDEVSSALQDLNFDILMLQESPIKSTGNFSQSLAERLGFASVFYPAMINQGQWLKDFSAFGQATLSRHPIISFEIIGLNRVYDWRQATQNKADSKRHALYTQVKLGEKSLGIYNIHLDPFTSPSGRLEQLKPALSHIQGNTDHGVIVGGDLNLWLRKKESVVRELTSLRFDYLDKDNQPFLDLDHFMTRDISNISAIILEEIKGSDHQPVEINLSL